MAFRLTKTQRGQRADSDLIAWRRSAPPISRPREHILVRIALITRRYPPLIGGAEKVLSYLARALAEAGADVTVVTSQLGSGKDGAAIVADSRPAHPSLRVVHLATSRLRFFGTWLYMRNLRRWLAQSRVDLAYVSMLKHDAYVTVGEALRRAFPVVLRPEGAGATGDLAWQHWGRFGRQIALRCRKADAVVAISAAIRAELEQAGYDPARIHDLPNGVPIPAEPWHPRPGWREAPRAVFVGRLAPEKALAVLLDAWPLVRARYPAARLSLVGEGPERPALEAQRTRLGLRDAVELPGAASEPLALLRNADLFVLPSREEGMSIALLEAMALGIPLVASAIPGNQRLVTEGVHGRLVAPGDAGALARAIIEQWDQSETAQVRGLAGRAHVASHYSIEAVARRHLELFENLIVARKSAR